MQLTDARAGLVLGGVTAVAVALAVLPVVRRLDAVEPEPAGSMV